MKPETRKALEDSRKVFQHGLDLAIEMLDAFRAKLNRGQMVSPDDWNHYYNLGVKAGQDIARIASLELRDEAMRLRNERRKDEPDSPGEALEELQAAVQANAGAAKDEKHAPDSRPKLHEGALREAWTDSNDWVQLAAQTPEGAKAPPLPRRVRKVLPAMGIAEQDPLITMHRFREEAARRLKLQVATA